jgi:hypothetical protein
MRSPHRAEQASFALRARRFERDEWQRQWRLAELRRQKLTVRIKKETARRENLLAQVVTTRSPTTGTL